MPKPSNSSSIQKERKPRRVLNNAERNAIIAACSVPGARKALIAKEFGIVPETLSHILREVKLVQSPSNPLAKDFKRALTTNAVEAVQRGLQHQRDVYRAADIGVKVLTGLGEFIQGANQLKVDTDLNIQIQWGRSQENASIPIDVTPLDEKSST